MKKASVNVLPPIPQSLIKKAEDLNNTMNQPGLSVLEQLEIVYEYLNDFKPYISEYASCSKGCSHCCNYDVHITRTEAEYIYVKTGITFQEPKKFSTKINSPCSFLTGSGECSIYEHRPMVCRFLYAFGDPENCKPGKEQEQYGVQQAGFGNGIFKSLIDWLHRATINTYEGIPVSPMSDIRDYFDPVQTRIQMGQAGAFEQKPTTLN